nr:hypothetical protein BgiMline_002964 [Biomphalaria glabrata]
MDLHWLNPNCPEFLCPMRRLENLLWRDYVNEKPNVAHLPRFHRPPIVQRYMRQCPVNSLCAARCSPNFSHFDWSPYEASYSGPEHMCYIRHRNFG